MKTNQILAIALVAIMTGSILASCGGKRQSTSSKVGYELQAKDECQELALKDFKRAAGIAEGPLERLTTNAAALDARNNLVAAIRTVLVGMIENWDQARQAAGGDTTPFDFLSLSEEKQTALIYEQLNNSPIICSNAYYNKETKMWKVYACVELEKGALVKLHNTLSQDRKMEIAIGEKEFDEKMQEALKKYYNARQ